MSPISSTSHHTIHISSKYNHPIQLNHTQVTTTKQKGPPHLQTKRHNHHFRLALVSITKPLNNSIHMIRLYILHSYNIDFQADWTSTIHK
jgi:hypothetical protein